ncbi:acyltransferase domain-containing protein [Bdellovibrio sp. HCB2-146]|uniref:acyltransferase domain-containing protein n=1 Tax=Bdellovibrio sp. HCB2-146 TaxID=3394362 RepID=UPI0039BCDD8B
MRKSDRQRFLHLPEVQSYFQRAEKIMNERCGLNFNFQKFLEKSTEEIYSLSQISYAAVAICAIQTGVADRLQQQRGAPDWVMGCSLGDLARAVFAGAYSFEDAVYNHIKFTQGIDGIDKIGRNIGVLAPRDAPFTEEDFLWFEQINVDVSCLTPRFLNIGGRYQDLEKVEERANAMRWNTMSILDYPAHSRYILPYVQAVETEFAEVQTHKPRIPIFSSLSAQPLEDPSLIREEFLLSITRTIHWAKAVQLLVSEKGVVNFINIGPCRSLSGIMKDIPVSVSPKEAFDLI